MSGQSHRKFESMDAPADAPRSIGDLAVATGTKAETIRWYERVGLLPAPARQGRGNYRTYGKEHLDRLSFLRRARDLGFNLEQVRALLDLADQKDQDCAAVSVIARAHLDAIERKLADLTVLREELRRVVGQCQHGRIDECRIIEALAPGMKEARQSGRRSARRG
mgnify:CR=1 FL=1